MLQLGVMLMLSFACGVVACAAVIYELIYRRVLPRPKVRRSGGRPKGSRRIDRSQQQLPFRSEDSEHA